jgi:hypothetical protein
MLFSVIVLTSLSFCAKPKRCCAKIRYTNKKSGVISNYTLNVEVKNNKLKTIYFRNGGWLDNSHFTEPEFNSKNETEFISDANAKYNVILIDDKYCDF